MLQPWTAQQGILLGMPGGADAHKTSACKSLSMSSVRTMDRQQRTCLLITTSASTAAVEECINDVADPWMRKREMKQVSSISEAHGPCRRRCSMNLILRPFLPWSRAYTGKLVTNFRVCIMESAPEARNCLKLRHPMSALTYTQLQQWRAQRGKLPKAWSS